MPFSDYRKVYNVLNYDDSGIIDFQKFCLINIDRCNDIDRLIQMTQKNKELQDKLREERENGIYYDRGIFSSKFPRRANSLILLKNENMNMPVDSKKAF